MKWLKRLGNLVCRPADHWLPTVECCYPLLLILGLLSYIEKKKRKENIQLICSHRSFTRITHSLASLIHLLVRSLTHSGQWRQRTPIAPTTLAGGLDLRRGLLP